MRPDLYREVQKPVPRHLFAVMVGLSYTGYQPASMQIAEENGKRVGAVFVQSQKRSSLSWSTFEKTAYLDNVVVLPEHRRRGIGTVLLDAARDWAIATGHQHMHAKIININEASLGLFKKAGFGCDSTNVGMQL